MNLKNLPLILASSSPARRELLSQIALIDHIIPAYIDETPLKNELSGHLALRLAQVKAKKVAENIINGYIIGADSVISVGRRILPKAENDAQVEECLNLLSGKKHKSYTAIYMIKKVDNLIVRECKKLVVSSVKFKKLTQDEINFYLRSKEGLDKAGGYSIQGKAQIFINYIQGSNSSIVGLPLAEIYNILKGNGYIFL